MREDASRSESIDELDIWDRRRLTDEKNSLQTELLYGLSEGEIRTRSLGPANVRNEDGATWYFHVIETVAGDVHIRSEPLSDLEVNNAVDATRRGADCPSNSQHVKGYSLEVLGAWGGSHENVEALYATIATTDQARLERLQRVVAGKILELRSLSAVRDWLLQEQKDIVSSVTLQA